MIDGIIIKSLRVNADGRGSFSETFRRTWLHDFEAVQINRSFSKAGVLRGLHYHKYQADYWFLARGRVRVGLFDMRPSSPTYEESFTMTISDCVLPDGYIYIPAGVAHGYYAFIDSVLIYVVDQTYDPKDDLSLRWDSAGIDWGIKGPVLSERDASAPTWAQIKTAQSL